MLTKKETEKFLRKVAPNCQNAIIEAIATKYTRTEICKISGVLWKRVWLLEKHQELNVLSLRRLLNARIIKKNDVVSGCKLSRKERVFLAELVKK